MESAKVDAYKKKHVYSNLCSEWSRLFQSAPDAGARNSKRLMIKKSPHTLEKCKRWSNLHGIGIIKDLWGNGSLRQCMSDLLWWSASASESAWRLLVGDQESLKWWKTKVQCLVVTTLCDMVFLQHLGKDNDSILASHGCLATFL